MDEQNRLVNKYKSKNDTHRKAYQGNNAVRDARADHAGDSQETHKVQGIDRSDAMPGARNHDYAPQNTPQSRVEAPQGHFDAKLDTTSALNQKQNGSIRID